MEFVLGLIKITAVTGFIIFGIVVDCGGVKTDSRGYIGARYWHDPGAFLNGFKVGGLEELIPECTKS